MKMQKNEGDRLAGVLSTGDTATSDLKLYQHSTPHVNFSTNFILNQNEVEVSLFLHLVYFSPKPEVEVSSLPQSFSPCSRLTPGEVEVSSLPPPPRKTTLVAGGDPRTLKERKLERVGTRGPLKEP